MIKSILYFFILAALVAANALFFSHVLGVEYFEWYLAKGPLITLPIAFISLIWSDLDRNRNLISSDPAEYLPACFWVVSVVLTSMAGNLDNALAPVSKDKPRVSVIRLLWDSILSITIYLVLFVLVAFWLLIIVPILYFIYLVAGAPVRMGLFNQVYRVKVKSKKHTETVEIAAEEHVDDPALQHAAAEGVSIGKRAPKEDDTARKDKKGPNTLDVTFTNKPVTVTATIASILLMIAGFVLEYYGIIIG